MIRLLSRGRTGLLGLLVLNGFGQAAAAVVAALAVQRAFEQLASDPAFATIATIAAGLAASTAAMAFLRGRERIEAERLGQSYCHDMRVHLFYRLTAMSPRSVAQRRQGSTALRFVGDLTALQKWVSLGIARLAVAVTMIFGTLTALWFVNSALAVATAAAAAIGAGGAISQGPALRRATRDARRRRARLAGRVTEAIGSVGVVQAGNAVESERRRIRRSSRQLRDAMVVRARLLGRLQAIAEATGSAATALLLITALVVGIPAPAVAAGMAVVGLLVPQLRGLARVQEYRQQQLVARDAIHRFLDRPPMLSEPIEPIPLGEGPGHLELVGASLDIVLDVTISAPAGSTIAVVGPNGAGKSTLMAMIGRLVDLDDGQVLLDGADLAAVSLPSARSAISMAGPDLPLMSGTLRHNITYRDRTATDDEIADVVERCGLRHIVEALPNGLETKVAEGGLNLSSGQRQRVLLARALLGRPRLLLLDEADANVDAATSRILDDALSEFGGTALVITHRLERVRRADAVWHLADGRLVEHGRPDDLLADDGSATARLFTARERRVGDESDAPHEATAPDLEGAT